MTRPRRKEKITTLKQALRCVHPTATVVLGGSLQQNKPMAAVRELVRHAAGHLTLVAPPAGSIDVDLLIGAGLVDSVRSAYVGFEELGLAPHFRRHAEQGLLTVWECDEAHLLAALEAASRAAPSGLTCAGLGTSLLELNRDLRLIADPFTGQPVVAVQALRADVAILHAQASDPFGNVYHSGSLFADVLIAQAVKRQGGTVIVTVDEIQDRPMPNRDPRSCTLPHILVDSVVEVPYGAHPCGSHGRYGCDRHHLKEYLGATRSAENWAAYVDRYITSVPNQMQYLEKVGGLPTLFQLGRAVYA